MLRLPPFSRAQIRARVALALAIVFCLPMVKRELNPIRLIDFHVYLTAAQLVREHQSAHLYDEADTGRDPELQLASANGIFAQTAHRLGIPGVSLYLYPPLLADSLVPLTFLTLTQARIAWIIFNLLVILATAAVMVRLVGVRLLSFTALLITLCLLGYRPNLVAAYFGQVTFLLLLLWTLGIYFYVRGHVEASAVMFALATALKLTPVLALLPMLLWHEWRWARWFAGTLASCVAAMVFINGPATVLDYARHVLPSMAGGIPAVFNLSLQSAIQVIYLDLAGGNIAQEFLFAPRGVVLLGKLVSLAVIAFAMWQIFRLGLLVTAMERARLLALVALLSVCTAPVSWRHAYSLGFLALLLLWKEALAGRASNFELGLLTFTTIEFSFFLDTLALKIGKLHALTHGPLVMLLPTLAPVCGLALVFAVLHRMRTTRVPVAY